MCEDESMAEMSLGGDRKKMSGGKGDTLRRDALKRADRAVCGRVISCSRGQERWRTELELCGGESFDDGHRSAALGNYFTCSPRASSASATSASSPNRRRAALLPRCFAALHATLGSAEGWFGVDDPIFAEKRTQPGREELGMGEQCEFSGQVS